MFRRDKFVDPALKAIGSRVGVTRQPKRPHITLARPPHLGLDWWDSLIGKNIGNLYGIPPRNLHLTTCNKQYNYSI
ncbi:MAG: hypothetical protein U1F61_15455 [Opitutaceae bacterium]